MGGTESVLKVIKAGLNPPPLFVWKKTEKLTFQRGNLAKVYFRLMLGNDYNFLIAINQTLNSIMNSKVVFFF